MSVLSPRCNLYLYICMHVYLYLYLIVEVGFEFALQFVFHKDLTGRSRRSNTRLPLTISQSLFICLLSQQILKANKLASLKDKLVEMTKDQPTEVQNENQDRLPILPLPEYVLKSYLSIGVSEKNENKLIEFPNTMESPGE